MNAGKAPTVTKGIKTDSRDRTGDVHTGQTPTAIKGATANGGK